MPHPTPLTPAIALAHERLYPRVTALLKQVERSATRHPERPVPVATLEVGKTLFAEARKILGRDVMRMARAATSDLSALSVGLSQLVAMLEAFEAAHSGFSARARCTVWQVEGPALPVARLKPAGVQLQETKRPTGVEPGFRSKLYKRMCERENMRYLQGFRDAQAGRPPIPPIKFLDGIPQE